MRTQREEWKVKTQKQKTKTFQPEQPAKIVQFERSARETKNPIELYPFYVPSLRCDLGSF